MYGAMAHFVGKILKIRPGEILDTWTVPELIVAYGEYANEIADKNYKEWKAIPPEHRGSDRPPRYIVQFIGVKDMNDG